MNKSEISYIQDEMNNLKRKVVERAKKLAVRKEENYLALMKCGKFSFVLLTSQFFL